MYTTYNSNMNPWILRLCEYELRVLARSHAWSLRCIQNSARVRNMYVSIHVRMYVVTIAQPFGIGKVEGRFGVCRWVMTPNQTPNPQGGGMSQVPK